MSATCWGNPTSMAYDANGNEIATVAPDFREQAWTSFGKPLEVRSRHGRMKYTYDAEHRRVKKERVPGALSSMTSPQLPAANDGLSGVWDTTLFIGDGYERRAISGTSSVDNVFYVRAAGRPIAEMIWTSAGTEQWRYLHTDRQGTVERTTDAAGVLKEMTSYDAWGVRRRPDWTGTGTLYMQDTRLGYTGHRQDDEFAGNGFGVIDMGGRTYDTFYKRFTSPDPIVQAPAYGPSWNRYSYVFNSPLNFTDPTGHLASAHAQGGLVRNNVIGLASEYAAQLAYEGDWMSTIVTPDGRTLVVPNRHVGATIRADMEAIKGRDAATIARVERQVAIANAYGANITPQQVRAALDFASLPASEQRAIMEMRIDSGHSAMIAGPEDTLPSAEEVASLTGKRGFLRRIENAIQRIKLARGLASYLNSYDGEMRTGSGGHDYRSRTVVIEENTRPVKGSPPRRGGAALSALGSVLGVFGELLYKASGYIWVPKEGMAPVFGRWIQDEVPGESSEARCRRIHGPGGCA